MTGKVMPSALILRLPSPKLITLIPNLDAGVEDKYLKDQLYREVLGEFMRRLEIRALHKP